MCIFCGGQCGGMGEFLISLGLPFLALYFFRIKRALATLKNRVLRRNPTTGIPAEAVTCQCCGESLADCRQVLSQPLSLQDVDLLTVRPFPHVAVTISPAAAPAHPRTAAANTALRGVKGWLLLICLNFTIIIPAAYLYQLNCLLDLYTYMQNRIFLVMYKEVLLYTIINFGLMFFLAIFSFYTGLRLWHLKPKAVATAKTF